MRKRLPLPGRGKRPASNAQPIRYRHRLSARTALVRSGATAEAGATAGRGDAAYPKHDALVHARDGTRGRHRAAPCCASGARARTAEISARREPVEAPPQSDHLIDIPDRLVIRRHTVIFVDRTRSCVVRSDRVYVLVLHVVAGIVLEIALERHHRAADVLVDVLHIADIVVGSSARHELAESAGAGRTTRGAIESAFSRDDRDDQSWVDARAHRVADDRGHDMPGLAFV